MNPVFEIYTGRGIPQDVEAWPAAPPWRTFDGVPQAARRFPEETGGYAFHAEAEVVDAVNAAICLRRPVLVTGKPGTGKSSLARAVARELRLGKVLTWPINSKSTRQEGLYHYDAIGRLQDASLAAQTARASADQLSAELTSHADIGRYLRLGPLGTALLPAERPRVLLIDEIDKSDVDLPNDLLHVFEEGEFEIPELARVSTPLVEVRTATGDGGGTATIENGVVRCREFPIVILTSNDERDFPAAFKRRCIRIDMGEPGPAALAAIVKAHFSRAPDLYQSIEPLTERLIQMFIEARGRGNLATDQLLNLLGLQLGGADVLNNPGLQKVSLKTL